MILLVQVITKYNSRSIIHLFSAMVTVYMVVFGNMANLSHVAILERFWLLPNILLVCIAGQDCVS